MSQENDVEITYHRYFQLCPSRTLDSIDVEQVKKELCDSKVVMDIATKVYYSVTHGRISKPNTDAVVFFTTVEDLETKAILETEKETEQRLKDAGYRLIPELKLLSAGEMAQVIWEAGKKYEEAGGDLARIAQIQRFIWIAEAQLNSIKKQIGLEV